MDSAKKGLHRAWKEFKKRPFPDALLRIAGGDSAMREDGFAGIVERVLKGKRFSLDILNDCIRAESWDETLDQYANADYRDSMELKKYLDNYDRVVKLCFEVHGYKTPD